MTTNRKVWKVIVIAVVAYAVAMATVCMVVWADEIPDEPAAAPVVEEAPTLAPLAALFITSCHQIVTAIIVTTDGEALFFDSHSSISADRVKELAATSKKPALVKELGCYKVSEDLST